MRPVGKVQVQSDNLAYQGLFIKYSWSYSCIRGLAAFTITTTLYMQLAELEDN